jgi:hypothetical protein
MDRRRTPILLFSATRLPFSDPSCQISLAGDSVLIMLGFVLRSPREQNGKSKNEQKISAEQFCSFCCFVKDLSK